MAARQPGACAPAARRVRTHALQFASAGSSVRVGMPQSGVDPAVDAAAGANGRGELVFVSYSHSREDIDFRDRFLVMLKPLVRNKRLEVWADPYIEVGDIWRREIDTALKHAGLGLLLVSPDFLASDFIIDTE